jgi:hypothetical protein
MAISYFLGESLRWDADMTAQYFGIKAGVANNLPSKLNEDKLKHVHTRTLTALRKQMDVRPAIPLLQRDCPGDCS